MNKKIFDIVKENHIHPISYTKKGKIYLVSEKEKSYVIKLNTNNYDIYQYLISRNFWDFPESLNKKNANYDIVEYIEEIQVNEDQKINDLLEELAFLHAKTSYKRGIDIDNLKNIYETILEKIKKGKDFYYQLNNEIDKETFIRPSMYLLVRNISLIYFLLEYAEKEVNDWYQKIKNEKNVRVCLLHNNVDIAHLIINENKYLISWGKSHFDFPINDLISFYQKYYNHLDLLETIKIYEKKNKLSELEKQFFLIRLSLPEIIKLSSNTFDDTIMLYNRIEFFKKIFETIQKQNTLSVLKKI